MPVGWRVSPRITDWRSEGEAWRVWGGRILTVALDRIPLELPGQVSVLMKIL